VLEINYNINYFLNYHFYFIQSCICFEHNILGNAKTTFNILALLWLIIPNLIFLLLFYFNISLHKPNENLTPLMHLYNCVNNRQ